MHAAITSVRLTAVIQQGLVTGREDAPAQLLQCQYRAAGEHPTDKDLPQPDFGSLWKACETGVGPPGDLAIGTDRVGQI